MMESDIFRTIENQRIPPNLRGKACVQQASTQNQAGFTLLELVVVLSILSILVVMAQGSWSAMRADHQVRSAAEKIRSAMTAARLKALATGKPQYIGIDLINEKITSSIWEQAGQTFYNLAQKTWSPESPWEATQHVNLIDSKRDGSAPASPINGISTFKFQPRGTATSRSVLVQSQDTAVALGVVLTVNSVSGRVNMRECTFTDITMNCP